MDEANRQRTHRWSDPDGMARETSHLSPEDFFTAWKERRLIPPMAATLGFDLLSFGQGYVEIGCRPEPFHYNPYGIIHGGLAATLLDTATGCAVHTLLPKGTGYATLGLNVHYLRPITGQTGVLLCTGRVSSHGSRVAVAEADLSDPEGRRLARATSTCLILRPE